jgi:hypothetical protein
MTAADVETPQTQLKPSLARRVLAYRDRPR